MLYLLLSPSFVDNDPEKFKKLLKIGYTEDSNKRLLSYKHSNPSIITLKIFDFGDKVLESSLHLYFRKFRYKDYGREWFEYDESIVQFFEDYQTEESMVSELKDIIKIVKERNIQDLLEKKRNIVNLVLNRYIDDTKDYIGALDKLEKIDIGQIDLVDNGTSYFLGLGISSKYLEKYESPECIEVDSSYLDFIEKFNNAGVLYDKLKLLYDFTEDISDVVLDKILHYIPVKLRIIFEVLGRDRLKALGYNQTKIDKELKIEVFNKSGLGNHIRSTFKIGDKYTLSDLKEKLRELYDSIGYKATPKASDILDYFEVKEVSFFDKKSDGSRRRIRGYEILNYKK